MELDYHSHWLAASMRQEAWELRQLRELQAQKRRLLTEDKQDAWAQTAVQAEKAAEAGDLAVTYRLVKILGEYKPKQMPGILKADGTPTADAEEEQARWEEHFRAADWADGGRAA